MKNKTLSLTGSGYSELSTFEGSGHISSTVLRMRVAHNIVEITRISKPL